MMYDDLREWLYQQMGLPVYNMTTSDNQDMALPCLVFARANSAGSLTMNSTSIYRDDISVTAMAKTQAAVEDARDFLISLLDGYDTTVMQIIMTGSSDGFDALRGIYSRTINFQTIYKL